MRSAKRSAWRWVFVVAVVAYSECFSALPTRACAQTQGNNAVFNASGNCNSTSQCAASAAWPSGQRYQYDMHR
jgi:hypothetical protein